MQHSGHHQVLAFALALSLAAGCSSVPALAPRLDLPGGTPEVKVWLDAPIIVVGQITSVASRGKNSIRRGDWSIDVLLHEILVDVENVVKGHIEKASVRVYRYGFFDGPIPGNLPVDDILPGERRVLFLIPYGNDFRIIEDVVAGSFPVASGRHPQLAEGKSAAEQIARILVLPGEGFDEGDYVRTLDEQASGTVYFLVGLRRTVLLLRELMGQGPQAVSAQACSSLYQLQPFGDPCIDGLLQDSNTPEPMQTKALETVKLYGDGKRRQLEELRQQPAHWFSAWIEGQRPFSYVASSYQEDAQFILTEMAQRGDDPILRRNARMLLQDYVPKI